jgi:hypothetical protein
MVPLIIFDKAAACSPPSPFVLWSWRFPLPPPLKLYYRISGRGIVTHKLNVGVVFMQIRVCVQLFSDQVVQVFGIRCEYKGEAVYNGFSGRGALANVECKVEY